MVKKILVAVVGAGVLGLLVWSFMRGRGELAQEAKREEPVQAAPRVSVQKNETVIAIDPAEQNKSGIVASPLAAATHAPDLRALAQVLEIREWSEARQAYLAAKGEVIKATASAEESRRDLARSKLLGGQSTVSVETVQEADVKARSDTAAVQPAEDSLHLIESAMREQWGDALAGWLVNGSPELDDLFAQRAVLIRIILSAGTPAPDPAPAAMIQGDNGKFIGAQFVSRALRLDPRLQGSVLFYTVPVTKGGLVPGLTTTALLPRGEPETGVIVPSDAVVWSQGKPWIYLQKDAEHFARHMIATDIPAQGGWFVAENFSSQEKVVTKGAEQLLSEEFRSQIQVGEK
ncbi:MAG: hypothetical protein ABI946_11170 [Chthoniobacterales bacterium]